MRRANGVGLLHVLGKFAAPTLAPHTGLVGALVAIPAGKRAEEYGLESVAPGIGRLRAAPNDVQRFGLAHPELPIEIAPTLHPLLDRLGQSIFADALRRDKGIDGKGVLVGVADTGLDVTHPEMFDEAGRSRVAWLLDLSLPPRGVHTDLEKRFGIVDAQGNPRGAVLSKDMIDEDLARIRSGKCKPDDREPPCAPSPSDEVGHGTHVAGIAAARGVGGKYPGVAPAADIVFVRISRGVNTAIENDDLVRAVEFMFGRADAEKRPMVVNMSLGTDFGPHDGSALWEQAIASHIGPSHPGRAIVAAAGNSGSILETPIHQSVRVNRRTPLRVPIHTLGADSGSVQVWVTLREGADLRIGLDGPDGEWIRPIGPNRQSGKDTDAYKAGVLYGAETEGSPVPKGSNGAIVVWTGKWPSGTYYVTFDGAGMAELYMQGQGDAAPGGLRSASFEYGVREGTVNLPATHPDIIAVGCTVNRPGWKSIAGTEVALHVPVLDGPGRLAARDADGSPLVRPVFDGELCWFSSAGPTATGVPKPEIAAPGALVISALSRSALPGTPGSAFTTGQCSDVAGKSDPRCLQIDDTHAISMGTSMSSPAVAGVVALLLQKDPTLTQDKIVALLQAGAHRFRGDAPFFDQSGPGEVDALGALDALEQMSRPELQLPAREESWLTLSSDYVPADGSTTVTAIVELRTLDAKHRADFFDRNRLAPSLMVDGVAVDPPPTLVRRGPGLWFYTWKPPPGLGGSFATFGATFDGVPIVADRTVPIAVDGWSAGYAGYAKGNSCSMHAPDAARFSLPTLSIVALAFAFTIRRSSTRKPHHERPKQRQT